ncbi:PqiC family protein [Amaricoccus solimangrovi]|uniref:PqiC family protein n=1 Tax=Amaricoccus solimangrovi TaxID=2589815 RepID=UPI0015E3EEE2|nr:PqiC family protein [Amaricoccus solimangrovi]
MRAALTLPLLAFLCACGASDYYLLPPEAATAPARAGRVSLAVADIDLPAYAGALEVATLGQGGAVRLDPDVLWADTPQRALTRHLVAALQTRLGGQVMAEPWPAFDPPALQLRVIVDRMIGAPDTALDFAGQYILVSSSGAIVASERFRFTVPPQGPGYPGLLADHARAVELLADRIAARIAGRPAA